MYVCVWMKICIHTQSHTQIHTCAHTSIHKYTHTHAHAHAHTHTRARAHTHTHTSTSRPLKRRPSLFLSHDLSSSHTFPRLLSLKFSVNLRSRASRSTEHMLRMAVLVARGRAATRARSCRVRRCCCASSNLRMPMPNDSETQTYIRPLCSCPLFEPARRQTYMRHL